MTRTFDFSIELAKTDFEITFAGYYSFGFLNCGLWKVRLQII
jgi:hypothetical protein